MANKHTQDEKLRLIYACKGSMEYVKNNKSKGLFYCIDNTTGSVEFVDNIIKREHKMFDNYDEFMTYVNKEYV